MAEPYQVQIAPPAQRALRQLPENVQREVVTELWAMADNPAAYEHIPLRSALSGSMKLRVGSYRAIYTINHNRRLIRVWRVGPRESVYRGFEPR